MQSQNQISLLPLSLSRWETYQNAKRSFRDGSPREVFFESNSNTETRLADGKISNSSNREFGFRDISPSCLARDYKEPKIVQLNNPTHSNNCLYGDDGISPITPDRLEKRQNGRRFKEDGEPSFTINCQDRHGIYNGSRIRRLTPTECERLMGLPDGWTSNGIINDKEVEISDSQRYKLCGNGVVVNVVEEILKNIIKETSV